jgi:hypothetical protein
MLPARSGLTPGLQSNLSPYFFKNLKGPFKFFLPPHQSIVSHRPER